MADMTREEVDAKILANEARSDAQVATILGKIDALIARMDAFEHEMRETTRGIIVQMNSLKKTIIVTGITSVLAIVFGVASFNAALLNNMTATFQSGKEMGEIQTEIRKQAAETAKQAAETNQILAEIRQQRATDEAERRAVKRERGSGRN